MPAAVTITPADMARWRADPVGFIQEVLVDPETSRTYQLNRSQKRFLAKAFQLGKSGRPKYPELVYSAPKKSGKTAFSAMCVLYVLLVLSPPYSEAICCANDFDQAQGRTFKQIARIVAVSPLLSADGTVWRDKIEFASTHSAILAISSDAPGAAGSNASVTCFDELWGFVSEKSRRLWDEMTPPPTRRLAWRLTVSYAGYTGESELLESLYKRGMAGKLVGEELYATDDGLLMAWHCGPVAEWQTPQWVEQMRATLRPAGFLRLITNAWVTSESSFVDEAWIDECTDPTARPVVTDRKLRVWAGVDASVRRDATAIVLCTWDAVEKRVALVNHWIFTPTKADPIDFEQVVERTLLEIRQKYDLQAVYFDPYQMQASAQRLMRAGVAMREYPQTTDRLTATSQGLYDLFKAGGIRLYPDPDIRLALMRAVATESSRGWKISKTSAAVKIDVVIALSLAAHGAVLAGQDDSSGQICPVWVSDAPTTGAPGTMSDFEHRMALGDGGGELWGGPRDTWTGSIGWSAEKMRVRGNT